MIYDKTDAEIAGMNKAELRELYRNIREARKSDEGWFDAQRQGSLAASAAAFDKLKGEYRGMLENYTKEGKVTIGRDFSVEDRAELIVAKATLEVTKDNLKKAETLHKCVMAELERDGQVLNGEERYYEAEADLVRMEKNNYDLHKQLNNAFEVIGDLKEENAKLAAELATLKAGGGAGAGASGADAPRQSYAGKMKRAAELEDERAAKRVKDAQYNALFEAPTDDDYADFVADSD